MAGLESLNSQDVLATLKELAPLSVLLVAPIALGSIAAYRVHALGEGNGSEGEVVKDLLGKLKAIDTQISQNRYLINIYEQARVTKKQTTKFKYREKYQQELIASLDPEQRNNPEAIQGKARLISELASGKARKEISDKLKKAGVGAVGGGIRNLANEIYQTAEGVAMGVIVSGLGIGLFDALIRLSDGQITLTDKILAPTEIAAFVLGTILSIYRAWGVQPGE